MGTAKWALWSASARARLVCNEAQADVHNQWLCLAVPGIPVHSSATCTARP